MTIRPFLVLSLLVATTALADDDFPGLHQVMTPREWAHSGLDQLTPDQIAIIDSALTRHYAHTVAQAAKDATARAVAAAQAQHKQIAMDASRYGLPQETVGWREAPVLHAVVVGWVGDNRFQLDNKQVWEGLDYIPYELKGHSVQIQPRPFGEFALVLDGRSTAIRVKRVQ